MLCRDEITRDFSFPYSEVNIVFSVVLTLSKVAPLPMIFHSVEMPNQRAGTFSEVAVLYGMIEQLCYPFLSLLCKDPSRRSFSELKL